MSKNPVNRAKLPALSRARKAEISALAAQPDGKIDYSNLPPLTDEFWKSAMRNPFYRPTKASTTMRLDSDVLAWLKSQGKGYQTKINAILRREMLAALKAEEPVQRPHAKGT